MGWLDKVKAVLVWMWSNKSIALFIVLALVIAYLTWDRNRLETAKSTMEIERASLPDNIEFTAGMHGTNFEITYRDSKNNIIHKEFYVPEEGGIDITKKIDLKNYNPNSPLTSAVVAAASHKIASANPIINPIQKLIQNVLGPTIDPDPGMAIHPVLWGFTFAPGIGGLWSGGNKIEVGLDSKLFFWHRYSAGVGTTIDYPYIYVSRHVDDIVPFIKIQHFEIMAGYGRDYSNFSSSTLSVGGRTNF